MKYLICIILVSGILFSLNAQEAFPSEVNNIIKKYTKKRKNKGVVVGIVTGDRASINGFGKISKQKKVAPDEHTLFEIGGLTHVFTTTLMSQMSKDLGFNLDDHIQVFLPAGTTSPIYHFLDCRSVKVEPEIGDYYISDREVMVCVPNDESPAIGISFCDLASHTSGLPDDPAGLYSWNPLEAIRQIKDPFKNYTKKELYEHLSDYDLLQVPGMNFRYSNQGIALIGNLLEDIEGANYQDLIHKYITFPLGLKNTTVSLDKEQELHLAPGHNRRGKVTSYWHFDAMAPAGGLKSTGEDLLQFLKYNINTKSTFLEEALEEVQQERLTIPNQERPTTMGYGWFTSIINPETNRRAIWQSGQTGGFSSFLGFNKDLGIGVVILSNSANTVDELGFNILEQLYIYSLQSYSVKTK